MPIDDLPQALWWHVASGHPKNAIHDHGQIYDVAHHTTDILGAIGQKCQPGSCKKDHLEKEALLTCLQTCHGPNPGNLPQPKHGWNYEKLSLSI